MTLVKPIAAWICISYCSLEDPTVEQLARGPAQRP